MANSFPIITKEVQQRFETQNPRQGVPCICGYYGRACRQMGKAEGANRAPCMRCPLAEFAATAAMPLQQIAAILSRHSVPYRIDGGRIYADTMEAFTAPFKNVEDLTDYTPGQLRAWLGY